MKIRFNPIIIIIFFKPTNNLKCQIKESPSDFKCVKTKRDTPRKIKVKNLKLRIETAESPVRPHMENERSDKGKTNSEKPTEKNPEHGPQRLNLIKKQSKRVTEERKKV